MQTFKNTKVSWVKLVFFTFVFGLILSYIFYVSTIHYIYGQTCFTTQTVASDSRCLFILQGKVYQKGMRSSPHQGNTCGTDVTNIIPSFQAASAAKYLDPNFVGNICTVQPTATPIVQPTYPPTCATKSSGDADCNGIFDGVDYEIWRKEKMHEVTSKYSDLNGDGQISLIDFEIWRKTKLH